MVVSWGARVCLLLQLLLLTHQLEGGAGLQEVWAGRAEHWCRASYPVDWRSRLASLVMATESARRCCELGQLAVA